MRFVRINPPTMLTDDMTTAAKPRACGTLPGSTPPPQMIMPPAAVMPEIAFVTDMRGEWRAGATPQTVCVCGV